MLAGARLLSSLLEVVILRILDWRGIYDTEKIKSNDRNREAAEEFPSSPRANGNDKAEQCRKAAANPDPSFSS